MVRTTTLGVALAGLAALATSASAQAHLVGLQVQSQSWIDGSRFDEDGLRQRCAEAGVEIVAPKTAGAEATAVIQYSETRGPGFSMFGVGAPVGYGTNISYSLTLLRTGDAATIASLAATAGTPGGLSENEFHTGAHKALERTPAYRLTCDVIAATLGSRDRLAVLLPWAVLDGKARSLMQDLGFQPSTPEARASWAVARRDFSAAQSMGELAIEPLLSLFRNTTENRDGFGVIVTSEAANTRALVSAAGALAAIADDRASEGLAGFLNDHDAARSTLDRELEPALVASLRALGSVGTAFTVSALDEWSKAPGNAGREARRAAEQVRRRLVFSQQPAIGEVLAKAGAYVAQFKRDLAALVVEERYEQDAKSPFGTVVTSVQAVPHRELKSDVMLVRPAGSDQFVLFRDVFEVDGRQVRDREERLMKLFLNPSGTDDEQIREIVTASARFNIGNVYRNINTPTLGLLLLDPETQSRFRFRLADADSAHRRRQRGGTRPLLDRSRDRRGHHQRTGSRRRDASGVD
jgi:hypothetical protein